jgi:hypothetical protein
MWTELQLRGDPRNPKWRVRSESVRNGRGHNSMQRRDFLKSGMVLAVAAELGALKARLVSAHNWSVASDPTSSFQVRSKGKTIKGLMGDDVPYFGDHVEPSDNHDDFASTLGVEGVVGTQFVLPSLVQ